MQGQPGPDLMDGAPPEAPQLNPGDYLRRAWRRKLVVLIPAILALAGGWAFLSPATHITTHRYKSKAKLVEELSAFSSELTGKNREKFTEEDKLDFMRLIYMLRQKVVNDPTMREEWKDQADPAREPWIDKAQRKALEWVGFEKTPETEEEKKRERKGIHDALMADLKKKLVVKPGKKGRDFVISFEAEDRKSATAVVETAITLFKRHHKRQVSSMAVATRKFINDMVSTIEEELRDVHVQISDFKVTNRANDPDMLQTDTLRYQALLDRLDRLEDKKDELVREREKKDREISMTEWYRAGEAPIKNALEAEVAGKRAELEEARRTKGEEHPDVRRLLLELEALRKALNVERIQSDAEARKARKEAPPEALTPQQQFQSNRRRLNAEREGLEEENVNLSGERKALQKKLDTEEDHLRALLKAETRAEAEARSRTRQEIDDTRKELVLAKNPPGTEETAEERADREALIERLEKKFEALQAEGLSPSAKEIEATQFNIEKVKADIKAKGGEVEALKKRLAAKWNVLDDLKEDSDLDDLRKKHGDTAIEVSEEAYAVKAPDDLTESRRATPKLDEIKPEEFRKYNPDFIDLLEQKEDVEIKIAKSQKFVDKVREDIQSLEEAFKTFPVLAVELERFRSKLKFLEKRRQGLMTRLNTVELRARLDQDPERGRRLIVLAGPSTPPGASWPPPWYEVLLICLGIGVGIGVLILAAVEMTDHSFWRSDSVERHLKTPVLAAIPIVDVGKRRFRKEAIVFRTSQEIEYYSRKERPRRRFGRKELQRIRRNNIATEQYRKLRLKLTGSQAGAKAPRAILVTSSIPEEGKTSVACNLAVAISQRIGEHVLLVDCDMRRPNVHNYFNVEHGPGLADYLQQETDLEQLLQKTEFEKLTVLLAGSEPVNPAELLASQRMRNLVKEMKSRYGDRIIIFDSSPLLATAEPNVLASQVDGTLMIVEAGRTPREIVQKALVSLEGSNVLGIVLNGATYEISSYFYPKDA